MQKTPIWNETALMESWRRSAQSGLLPDSTDRLYPLDESGLEALRQRYQTEIAAFHACTADRQLPRQVSFLLLDANGVLLEKKAGPNGISSDPARLLLCGGSRRDERGGARRLPA